MLRITSTCHAIPSRHFHIWLKRDHLVLRLLDGNMFGMFNKLYIFCKLWACKYDRDILFCAIFHIKWRIKVNRIIVVNVLTSKCLGCFGPYTTLLLDVSWLWYLYSGKALSFFSLYHCEDLENNVPVEPQHKQLMHNQVKNINKRQQ